MQVLLLPGGVAPASPGQAERKDVTNCSSHAGEQRGASLTFKGTASQEIRRVVIFSKSPPCRYKGDSSVNMNYLKI